MSSLSNQASVPSTLALARKALPICLTIGLSTSSSVATEVSGYRWDYDAGAGWNEQGAGQ
jgi:hypothetical protein